MSFDGYEEKPETSISSPIATGGSGTFFEQHVDAYWLAQLLVRAIHPILHDSAVVEVSFQTEHLGWKTDDFLVSAENGAGNRRKLIGQVKQSFTVSSTNDECRKAVQDLWMDFNNGRLFLPAVDRFALVTLRGTNTLLEHFSGLLDCSRAACDGADFEQRLATPGFISSKAVRYCDEIRAIIADTRGSVITAAEIWRFLQVLHVLSFDLNTATRQTEAMIKSMLAFTSREQDALGAAEISWIALLREVGQGMPQARTFQRDDLPETLRQRHSPVDGTDHRALRALRDHSAIILDSIRSTIGTDLHLSRTKLVQKVIEQLETTQVVLLSGAAGSGKSGIAKDAIGILSLNHFAFSFRAEEFATPHFDETLHRIQIPATAAVLGAILAPQGRKVLLVESVERLLEASTRDAFTDLLTLASRDKTWQLVLTCRDYSADLVRTCFLETVRIGHSVVTIPPLDDGELREIEAAHPTLARPLANAALRHLLRNPYILDKALQIQWSEHRPLPQSEREFRARFWQQIIRVEHFAGGGMPRRREEVFVQVALRRARALTLYAPCGDLDAAVLDALLRDSLILSPPESGVLVAPAHDVLEDWAILHWIEEQFATHHGDVGCLASALGTYPAVRRTYRKWVSELVDRDAAAADALFQAVVDQGQLSAQFRDDTLVSLLRSPASAALLEGHSTDLFLNDKQLLRRVIQLLRVACVTTPAWLNTTATQGSLCNVPDGPAWACVLRLVQDNLDSIGDADQALLLGLIEHWARGVSWQSPYPEGADSVAAIGYWLLPDFDDYASKDQRNRTLEVLAKIPNADRDRFAALLNGGDAEERDHAAEEFREIVFEGMVEGMPAARDLPEVVVSVAYDYLLCSEAELSGAWGYIGHIEIETVFGIKPARSHGFFPASAYRGPFLALLRHHPSKGLAFLISVLNHSADWYAHPRVESEYIEPPVEMMLYFADGTSRTQWCNDRLWVLYRGISVGPYALQSLLMALERWLLELGEARPRELDGVLLHILKESDSAALTAVVASIATAFPHASGETLLVLLRSPWCIRMDRHRLARESTAPSTMYGLMPGLNAQDKAYTEERKEADARPHRRFDLEMAVANLQIGPLSSRLCAIIDKHRADMPPVEEQDEEDRIWRLALHRMDLRQYTVVEDAPQDHLTVEGHTPSQEAHQYVRLSLKAPEPDVKEMVDRSAAKLEDTNARASLLMWGLKVYTGEEGARYAPDQWRRRLQEARSAVSQDANGNDERDFDRGGPGFVAAVCVRDHWEEMSDDDREWCLTIVCSEVELEANQWTRLARVQRATMSADRPCAWVLPLLLGKSLGNAQRARVRQALVVALTHAIGEVRWYAAAGTGKHLWQIDRELALQCVNALATQATTVQVAADAEIRLPYTIRRQLDDIERKAASLIRDGFYRAGIIANDAYQFLDITRWFGAEANGRILAILGQAPTEPAAVAAVQRLAHTLVAWWDSDDDHRQDRRERNHETESALTDVLHNFLLRTSATAATTILEPLLIAVDRHPDKMRWLVLGLISVEDRQPNTPQFWSLWKQIAEKIRRAPWLTGIDGDYRRGEELISAIFLGSWWKEEVRHWRSLEGYAHLIHCYFQELPMSATILDHYFRFLYHLGEQSLPEAFIGIATRLRLGDPRQLLRKGNTVFLLEVLLQRFVYGRPLALKRRADLRDAVLTLLDTLVENGSSAAFRMRDDFVTPISLIEV